MVAEIDDSDVPYEEEVLRNSYNVKSWMRYIEHKASGPKIPLYMVYERALKELPCSYKIWYKYLCLRRRGTRGRCIDDPEMNRVTNCYERALVFLHKVFIWFTIFNIQMIMVLLYIQRPMAIDNTYYLILPKTFYFPDAQNMDRLLSIHSWFELHYQSKTHTWPSPALSSDYSTLSDLAHIPELY